MRMLNVAALATCALLISLPSEAQTGKDLSQADLRKIDDATQTAMKAARSGLRDLGRPLSRRCGCQSAQ